MIIWRDQAPVGTKRGNSRGHNPVSWAVYRVWRTKKKGWCAMRGFKRRLAGNVHLKVEKVDVTHQTGPFETKEEAIAAIEVYDLLVGDALPDQVKGQIVLPPDKAGF